MQLFLLNRFFHIKFCCNFIYASFFCRCLFIIFCVVDLFFVRGSKVHTAECIVVVSYCISHKSKESNGYHGASCLHMISWCDENWPEREKFYNLQKSHNWEFWLLPFHQTKQIILQLHKIKFRRKLNTKIKLPTTLWQFPENLFIRKFRVEKGWKFFKCKIQLFKLQFFFLVTHTEHHQH